MYADDTKAFAEVEKESVAKLQQDLDMLVEWAGCCQLRFNADKCKVLHLGQNNPEQTYSMKQRGTGERVTLGTSEGEKDLGALMDSELKFSKRVEEQVNKANRILGLIRRSYQYLDRESMKMLFTALVNRHLEFGNVVLTPLFQKDRLLIKGVQRRATKLVPGLTELDYSERLKSMDLTSMK